MTFRVLDHDAPKKSSTCKHGNGYSISLIGEGELIVNESIYFICPKGCMITKNWKGEEKDDR